MRIDALATIVIGIAISAGRAQADPAPRTFDWSYLVDGGAAAFVWGSGAVALGMRLFGEPPETPRGFDPSEGGADLRDEQVPEAVVSVIALAGSAVVISVPSRSRLFHLKGYGEAVLTTTALTELAKAAFGRHRPYWTPEADDEARRSFFSAHASVTAATATYLGLFLHGHLFSRWREPGQAFAWWEVIPLAAIAAGPVWIASTRLDDNRHHLSDVIVGGAVGTTAAITFYVYQELRYRHAPAARRLGLAPSLGEASGVVLFGTF